MDETNFLPANDGHGQTAGFLLGHPIEPPGFVAIFYAKKKTRYFWPFSPIFSAPNFIKTQELFKNGSIYHS